MFFANSNDDAASAAAACLGTAQDKVVITCYNAEGDNQESYVVGEVRAHAAEAHHQAPENGGEAHAEPMNKGPSNEACKKEKAQKHKVSLVNP